MSVFVFAAPMHGLRQSMGYARAAASDHRCAVARGLR
jgi:hypothetical protein